MHALGACTYNVSIKGGGGVLGLLTNVNRGEGGVKDMLTLAGDIRVRTGKNEPLNEIIMQPSVRRFLKSGMCLKIGLHFH